VSSACRKEGIDVNLIIGMIYRKPPMTHSYLEELTCLASFSHLCNGVIKTGSEKNDLLAQRYATGSVGLTTENC